MVIFRVALIAAKLINRLKNPPKKKVTVILLFYKILFSLFAFLIIAFICCFCFIVNIILIECLFYHVELFFGCGSGSSIISSFSLILFKHLR